MPLSEAHQELIRTRALPLLLTEAREAIGADAAKAAAVVADAVKSVKATRAAFDKDATQENDDAAVKARTHLREVRAAHEELLHRQRTLDPIGVILAYWHRLGDEENLASWCDELERGELERKRQAHLEQAAQIESRLAGG